MKKKVPNMKGLRIGEETSQQKYLFYSFLFFIRILYVCKNNFKMA